MKRKTISVEAIKTRVNNMIYHSVDANKEGRVALGIMLENVLHDTGNYKGFGYLTATDMRESKEGMSVGIRYELGEDRKWENTDSSRVYYF